MSLNVEVKQAYSIIALITVDFLTKFLTKFKTILFLQMPILSIFRYSAQDIVILLYVIPNIETIGGYL